MTTPDRFNDLNKQGFMKLGRAQKAKGKKARPMVACDFCKNWHPKNQHTATAEERAENVAREKAKTPSFKPVQREL